MSRFEPMLKRFKVWHIEKGRWLTLSDLLPQIDFQSEECRDQTIFDIWDIELINYRYDHDDVVIVQSTNLVDGNSEEIFEGSIIKDHNYHVNGEPLLTAVVPHKQIAGYTLSRDGETHSNLLLSRRHSYEVIGHILSNPKMLKEWK